MTKTRGRGLSRIIEVREDMMTPEEETAKIIPLRSDDESERALDAIDHAIYTRKCAALAEGFSAYYTKSTWPTVAEAFDAYVDSHYDEVGHMAIDAHRLWSEAQQVANRAKAKYEALGKVIDASTRRRRDGQ